MAKTKIWVTANLLELPGSIKLHDALLYILFQLLTSTLKSHWDQIYKVVMEICSGVTDLTRFCTVAHCLKWEAVKSSNCSVIFEGQARKIKLK